MHRELEQFYVADNTVIVQLRLQGTYTGPLELPSGTVPPTGKRMDATGARSRVHARTAERRAMSGDTARTIEAIHR